MAGGFETIMLIFCGDVEVVWLGRHSSATDGRCKRAEPAFFVFVLFSIWSMHVITIR